MRLWQLRLLACCSSPRAAYTRYLQATSITIPTAPLSRALSPAPAARRSQGPEEEDLGGCPAGAADGRQRRRVLQGPADDDERRAGDGEAHHEREHLVSSSSGVGRVAARLPARVTRWWGRSSTHGGGTSCTKASVGRLVLLSCMLHVDTAGAAAPPCRRAALLLIPPRRRPGIGARLLLLNRAMSTRNGWAMTRSGAP